MSRYLGPVWKKSRRLGFSILETGKELARRPYAPGQHGQRRSKLSEYGVQLHEKQKLRFMYGIGEKQFRKIFSEALRKPGRTGDNFMYLLERRLDNMVYRAGFALTRRQARQLVNHGHILLDGKKASIPSMRVKPGQSITLREGSKSLEVVKKALEATISRKDYIEYDEAKQAATLARFPERSEFLPEIKENLIVEFYSR
jgi:small subunit ribosomal protein S4